MEEYDAIANELSKLNAQSVALYDSKGQFFFVAYHWKVHLKNSKRKNKTFDYYNIVVVKSVDSHNNLLSVHDEGVSKVIGYRNGVDASDMGDRRSRTIQLIVRDFFSKLG